MIATKYPPFPVALTDLYI